MVEILTLLLGMTFGQTVVELRADEAVARIELWVDGSLHRELTGPPWRVSVDWGEEILPHKLEAVAYDAMGQELGRDMSWVNLRNGEIDAKLVFPPAGPGRRIPHFGLRWSSLGIVRPSAVRVALDDKVLAVDTLERIELPAYDPKVLHWLSVEIEFGDKGTVVLGASLGGENLIELSSELTPLAVRVDSRRAASRLEGALRVDGRPAAIQGIEKGSAEVFFVVDEGAVDLLLELSNRMVRDVLRRRLGQGNLEARRGREISQGVESQARVLPVSERVPDLARFGTFSRDTRLSFIWPRPASWLGSQLTPEMFLTSPTQELGEVGLLAAVTAASPPARVSRRPRAVAIAGLAASSTTRRRAVVLLATGLDDDPAEVAKALRYLEAIKVPLYVWLLRDLENGGSWPVSKHLVSDLDRPDRIARSLESALEDLDRDLRRQRVVWLKGAALPQSISLDPAVKGVRWP